MACTSDDGSGPSPSDAGEEADDAVDVQFDAGSDAALASRLTLSLDPAIDPADDDVRATEIVSAVLLDANGAAHGRASVGGGAAVFDLKGVTAGDYFILVNGIADHLVPTRIVDPSAALVQRVGQKLSASYIGPAANPTYRIATYPDGQVVKFSDETPIASERPYLKRVAKSWNVMSAVLEPSHGVARCDGA